MTPASLLSHGLTLENLQQILYGNVDGYGLSNMGRSRIGTYSEDFTYGEVTPEVVYDMLNMANAKEGETFCDLGCGTGKAVLYAGLLFPLKKSVGIELLPELHSAATEAHDRYRTEILWMLPEEKRQQQIEFHNADMLTHDYSDADIVFAHCTCFSPALMEGMTQKLEQLKPGSRVFTVSKELPSSQYALKETRTSAMAWGQATLYLYERM